MGKTEDLQRQIAQAEQDLARLKTELAQAQADPPQPATNTTPPATEWKWPLSSDEYERYSRQLIVPGVGTRGQLRLKSASVLLVGAGGLGCPAAAYLAGAGVGTIGLVDGDTVEVSNLHRQIAHSSARVGMLKVDSAIAYLQELNPLPRYVPHRTPLTPSNAPAIVSQYDLVLDCTDRPATRYLVSDICVLLGRPLVSASAFRTDGQLVLLNCPPLSRGDATKKGGPCYRCLFPRPPPAETVVSCGEGGVLGMVVGAMGVLQALEATKAIIAGKVPVVAGSRPSNGNRAPPREISSEEPVAGSERPKVEMLLFAAASSPMFRTIKMRGRRDDCFACSAVSTLSIDTLESGSLDYVQFCGIVPRVNLLGPEERVSPSVYYQRVYGQEGGKSSSTPQPHVLLDVREKEHFDVANINGAVNVPLGKLMGQPVIPAGEQAPVWMPPDLPPDAPIYVVCRVGNDSQTATKKLKEAGLDMDGQRFIGDIQGGMMAWKQQIDPTLPFT